MPNDADSLTESDIEDDAVESEVVDTSGDSTADDAPASVYPDEAFETLADDDPDDLDDLDDLGSAGGTEAFDFEDAQFWLGEDEYLADERSVILVPASAEAISGEMAVPGRPLPRMSRAERRRRVRLQARRVRRVIRHVEPWSVLKISLLFYACLWVIFLVAGFMIWGVAVASEGLPKGGLEGEYAGVSAEIAAVYGVGVNALILGENSIALQPISVEGGEGFNIAAGVAQLNLRADKQ